GVHVTVLDSISFEVASGAFVAFFGPNGCGKSTMFRIIGGIDTDFSGEVKISGFDPVATKIGHVFQDYNASLFPWMTLIENVTFGLRMADMPKGARSDIGRRLLENMDLLQSSDAFPYQLSGGMKQKTCIARALAADYKVLLLDEPFSALDHDTTYRMQQDFLRLWQPHPRTTLFISHDVDEAILLSDQIVVLSGRPAKVLEVVKNPLSRPRTIDMILSNEFLEVRNKIIALSQRSAQCGNDSGLLTT
ncbi:MAG: ABC transporter ATP-binding protein, partial [Bacteroidota bacterium]